MSPEAQLVKNLPAMQETQVWSLGREDPLEKKWQSTPVFLPGESHGQRSLVGYSPWGRKESNTTQQLTTHCLSWLLWRVISTLWTHSENKGTPHRREGKQHNCSPRPARWAPAKGSSNCHQGWKFCLSINSLTLSEPCQEGKEELSMTTSPNRDHQGLKGLTGYRNWQRNRKEMQRLLFAGQSSSSHSHSRQESWRTERKFQGEQNVSVHRPQALQDTMSLAQGTAVSTFNRIWQRQALHLWVCFSDVDPGCRNSKYWTDAAGGEHPRVLDRWHWSGGTSGGDTWPGGGGDREAFGSLSSRSLGGSFSCRCPGRYWSGVITPFLVEFKSLLKTVNKWWAHWGKYLPIKKQQLFFFLFKGPTD